MHATIRRYEGIDQDRTEELTRKVGESLLPRLSEMPGFKSYHLIEADKGVMSSIDFFDTSVQADESTRVAATWVREEKLEAALPNPPKVTGGDVIVEKTDRGENERTRPRVTPTAARGGPHRGPPQSGVRCSAHRFAELTAQRGQPHRGRPSWPKHF